MTSLYEKLNRTLTVRTNLKKILGNIGWLFSGRFLQLSVGLIVGVWVARYLGPQQFGLLSYALAFVALFTPVATLGLKTIVVREIVTDPDKTGKNLGTSFVLHLIGGVVAYSSIVVFVFLLHPDDAVSKIIISILGSSLIFKAGEVAEYWFEAEVKSKYTVWVQTLVLLVAALIKVGMILNEYPLIAFVWVILLETVATSVALLVAYSLQANKLTAWKADFPNAKILLQESWPLMLSGLAIMVYMRIDQVMLGSMIGDESVGIYSAAARISEVWYLIPTIIVATVFPSLIEYKKQNEKQYYRRLQNLYDLMVVLALVIAVPIAFSSDWIVMQLFGPAYASAGAVLSIHIWAGVFVFIGVASGRWILLEGMSPLMFYRTLLGAIVNVLFNLVLIPEYGPLGAAIATVFSFSVAGFWFDMFLKKTRLLFVMKVKSLVFWWIYVKASHLYRTACKLV